MLKVCTVNKVSFVSFLSNFSTVFHLFCFYTFYCLFGVSGVNSSLCEVGSILTPVSWGVSEICSFFRGTTALVSCVINCARWRSTGPVRILATWRTCSFSGLAFLLEATLFCSGCAGHLRAVALFLGTLGWYPLGVASESYPHDESIVGLALDPHCHYLCR